MFFKYAGIHLIFLPPSTHSLVHSIPHSFVHICIELEVRCNLLCFLTVPNNFTQKVKDYRAIPRNLPLIPSSLLWSQAREQLAAENSGAFGLNICAEGLYTEELEDEPSDPRFDPNTHITRLSWQE